MHPSYWSRHAGMPRFPKLDRDLRIDVAVIGGGIAGTTAAFLLKRSGRSVALLERDHCGSRDTGLTTAHLTFVTDRRLHRLVETFGEDHARAAWDAGRAAMEQVATLVREESLDCDFGRVPGFLHAPWGGDGRSEVASLQEDARLASRLGFDAAFLTSVPFAEQPGVVFPNQARFHPLQYLSGLLRTIPGDGSHVFEQSEVVGFEDRPRAVEANGHRVQCGSVVVATHVPLQGASNYVGATLFQTKLASWSTYAVAARVPEGTIPDALFWDTADPYRYLRLQPRRGFDVAVLGGEDHVTGQDDDPQTHIRRLEERLRAMAPRAAPDSRWTGQVVETNDGLPYLGETAPGQFVATGFSGNGMTFGTLAGMMAVDWVEGRANPWRELFATDRSPVKESVWDYVRKNLDYPYYFLRDRLTREEGRSLADVPPGEGRILLIDGRKVAAYRSPTGEVATLSPSCTHLGCFVRWNAADATWDCPCHGSRFAPTGETLAGPAETPLERFVPTGKDTSAI